MKKVILLAMAALFAFAATSYAQQIPADKMKINNNKNAAHNFCWSCHDKFPKPNKTPGKTCTKCHTLPK